MCGILCLVNNNPLKLNYCIELLNKLQHRGQNSFGFSYLGQNNKMNILTIKGLIKDYINSQCSDTLHFNSNIFLGHTRYITSGDKNNDITQPIHCENKFGEFVFIFNGNIELEKYNKQFSRTFDVDTLLIKSFLENDINYNSFEEILIKFMNTFEKAYSIIIYFNGDIYCLRDRYGIRPLMYNETKSENIIISSELEHENKDVGCGEIIKITNLKMNSLYKLDTQKQSNCLFEYIYFMNKNTIWNNNRVENIREQFGYILAQDENPNIIENKDNYIVIGIPNTGIPSAKYYAETLNIKYRQLITKNKNINRTFILNTEEERKMASKNKYIFSEELNNKKIILFDDSIVRGITMNTLITTLKQIGVEEIHIRVASPQIKYECKYGIDIPTIEELLMNNYVEIDEATKYLGCDSLKFTNIDKIKRIFTGSNLKHNLCTECFIK